MYIPCHECANRRGFAYTKDCDSTCSYASIVKCRNDYIDELEAKLRKTEEALEKAYYIIGQLDKNDAKWNTSASAVK